MSEYRLCYGFGLFNYSFIYVLHSYHTPRILWIYAEDDPPEGFGVGPKKLIHLLQDRKISDLEKLGGVSSILLY